MKWRRMQCIWFIFLLVMGTACEMQEDVNVVLPMHEGDLIIECYLEPDNPYRALVTRSMDFYESEKLQGVPNAVITISSSDGTYTLKEIIDADTSYRKVYNYGVPDSVKYQEGKEFQLTVELNGQVKAQGRTLFLPKVSFGGYRFKYDADSLASLILDVEDNPAEENYYRLVTRGTNPSAGITTDDIWTDEKSKDGKLTIFTPYRLAEGWNNVVVNLYHIDKGYYEFLKSVQNARKANYNPFMQPSSIESAMEGSEATGIFTAISLTSDTIRIPRRSGNR